MEDVEMGAASGSAPGSAQTPKLLHSKVVSTRRPSTIDMALDDVIRTGGSHGPRGRRRPQPGSDRGDGSRRREPPHPAAGPRRDPAHPPHSRQPLPYQRPQHAGIQKPGPGEAGRRRVIQHHPQQQTFRISIANRGPQAQSKLQVSNLHHEVSTDDLYELFGKVGHVVHVHMYYDRAGRSNGIADVSFGARQDAVVAADRFHNVPLDGMSMRIEVLPVARRPPGLQAAADRVDRWEHDLFDDNNGRRRPERGTPHQRHTGEGRAAHDSKMSIEMLNDDLDAYMMSSK